jgi:hypothetical protein
MNFTKRDFKMIALGFFTLLIIDGIYNWEDFKEGWESVTSANTK